MLILLSTESCDSHGFINMVGLTITLGSTIVFAQVPKITMDNFWSLDDQVDPGWLL